MDKDQSNNKQGEVSSQDNQVENAKDSNNNQLNQSKDNNSPDVEANQSIDNKAIDISNAEAESSDADTGEASSEPSFSIADAFAQIYGVDDTNKPKEKGEEEEETSKSKSALPEDLEQLSKTDPNKTDEETVSTNQEVLTETKFDVNNDEILSDAQLQLDIAPQDFGRSDSSIFDDNSNNLDETRAQEDNNQNRSSADFSTQNTSGQGSAAQNPFDQNLSSQNVTSSDSPNQDSSSTNGFLNDDELNLGQESNVFNSSTSDIFNEQSSSSSAQNLSNAIKSGTQSSQNSPLSEQNQAVENQEVPTEEKEDNSLKNVGVELNGGGLTTPLVGDDAANVASQADSSLSQAVSGTGQEQAGAQLASVPEQVIAAENIEEVQELLDDSSNIISKDAGDAQAFGADDASDNSNNQANTQPVQNTPSAPNEPAVPQAPASTPTPDPAPTPPPVLQAPPSYYLGPSFVGRSAADFPDDINAGDSIGNVMAYDPNDNQLHYHVDNARLGIDSSTGNITVNAGTSFSIGEQINFTVTVTDPDGLYDRQAFDVNVFQGNDAPIINTINLNTIDENLAAGGAVGTVTATDSNVGDTITYDVSDNRFGVDVATGEITLNSGSTLDRETQSSIQLTVTATDQDGLADTNIVTINVGDVNDNAATISASGGTFAENATVFGTATFSDADATTVITGVSVTGDPQNRFGVDINTGAITLHSGQSVDYETAADRNIALTLTPHDGLRAGNPQVINLNVTDVNESAATISASGGTFAESATVFGTATFSDADATTVVTGVSVTGDPQNRFGVDINTGAITLHSGQSVDYETAADRNIVLTLTPHDGLRAGNPQVINLNVTDVNESAATISASGGTFAESATVFGTATFSDADATTVVTGVSVTGDPQNRFGVDINTGAITLHSMQSVDYETAADRNIVLTLTPHDGLRAGNPQVINLNVTDVNESAATISASGGTFAESATVFGTATFSDADATSVITGVSVTGDPQNRFGVDITTGAITLHSMQSVDYETAADRNIVLTLTPHDGLRAGNPQVINLNVTDVNESAATISASGGTFAESATVFGTATFSDADATTVVTGVSVTGDPQNRFGVDINTGAITLHSMQSVDYETAADRNIVLTLTPHDGLRAGNPQVINLNVTDVNDNAATISASGGTFAESATVFGTATFSDDDATTVVTGVSVTGDPQNRFGVDINTGAITLHSMQSVDYETAADRNIVLTLTPHDGLRAGNPQVINLNVTDVNESAATISASGGTFAESATVFGTATFSDADATSVITGVSVTGDPQNRFGVDITTGAITLHSGQSVDYETAADRNIVLTLTPHDGLRAGNPQVINLNVTDVNDNAATLDLTNTLTTQSENITVGAIISTITATDPDTQNSITYSVLGDNLSTGNIGIDSSTGIVTLDSGSLDYATAQNVLVTVQATDGMTGHEDTQILTLSVSYTDDNITIGSSSGNVNARAGDDTIAFQAYRTHNTVNAGVGNDTISLGSGNDRNNIDGGAGNDTISLGSGSDINTIDGGTGNDIIFLDNNNNNNTIDAGAGNDTISLELYNHGNNIDGGAGDDYIYVSRGDQNTITGGTGDDTFALDLGGNAWGNSNNHNIADYELNNNAEKIFLEGSRSNFINHITGIGFNNSKLYINYSMGINNHGGITFDNLTDSTLNVAAVTAISGISNQFSYLENNLGINFDAIDDTVGTGNDTINLREYHSNISINALAGDDTISLDNLNTSNTIDAGAGDDHIILNTSNRWNTINAGAGNDTISLNKYNDSSTIDAGSGNDFIWLSRGSSITITGGTEDDTFAIDLGRRSSASRLVITDYELSNSAEKIYINTSESNFINHATNIFYGSNNLYLSYSINSSNYGQIILENLPSTLNIAGVNSISGISNKFNYLTNNISINFDFIEDTVGVGNDTINLTEGHDYASISSGAGDDTISLDLSNTSNTIDAGAGDDHILLNTSNRHNIINAGAGNDTISLDYNNDSNTIDAGDGNDYIYVSGGDLNTITGGTGDDTFVIDVEGNRNNVYTDVIIADYELSGSAEKISLDIDRNDFISDITSIGFSGNKLHVAYSIDSNSYGGITFDNLTDSTANVAGVTAVSSISDKFDYLENTIGIDFEFS